MSEQQHGQPSPEASDAAAGRNGQASATSPARDGGSPSRLREALKRGPDDEADEAIARATAVIGEDEGDAS